MVSCARDLLKIQQGVYLLMLYQRNNTPPDIIPVLYAEYIPVINAV